MLYRIFRETTRQAGVAIPLSALAVYLLVFLILPPQSKNLAVILSIIPVMAVGWTFGLRAALLTVVLTIPLNTALMNVAGRPGWDALLRSQGGVLGTIALVAAGATVGRLSDLWGHLEKEVTDRKQAEEQLIRLSSFPEQDPNPLIETDLEGRVTYLNPVSKVRFPELAAAGLQHPMLQGLRSITRTLMNDGEQSVIREIELGDSIYEQKIMRVPKRDLIRIYSHDITEHMRTQEALRETEQLFRGIVENIRDVIFVVDHNDYKILYVNPAIEEIWGLSSKTLYERPTSWIDAIVPEHRDRVNASLEDQRRTGEFNENFQIIRPDHSVRWIHDRVFPIRNDRGEIFRVVGIAEDITKQMQAEQQTQASLQEKEVLLKEISHRVKNNLQLVSSLLRYQSATIKDKQAQLVFRESQDRIRSIALIHEKLYESKDLGKIDFADYIRSLTSSLFLSYGASSEVIQLKVQAEDVFLEVDTAIPCALIINELVSNSLQHAFPDGRQGEIRIEIRSGEDQTVLMVSDNGVGFPVDLDLRTAETLGLELVRTLVDQLEGTIELNGGTSAGGAGTPVPGTGDSSAPAGTSGTSFNITFADSEASNEIR